MQAGFLINLGDQVHVPIISFSATSPSLNAVHSSYFFQFAQNDSSQVKALSSIVKAFGWTQVVPVYVDNEFGEGVIPFLTDALEEVDARVPYRSAISLSATDGQIIEELYKHKHILKHPPDSKALTWRKIRSMFEIFNERDFNSRMFKSSQQGDVIAGNPDNIAGDANSPNNNCPESTSSFSSNHTDANFEFFVGQQTQSPGQASPEIVPSTTDPAIIIAEMHITPATAQDNN
ncbi:hypothetical protein GBA52_001775 [Prunus armeniaca]|nr:hypothetical protein GBA52_001775 [Prunus armeniaca]